MAGGPVNLRAYRPGDEAVLISLWNGANRPYAGYVPRTEEYWRWCILERPGVSNDGILVLEQEGEAAAYAALAGDGKVLEFVVDSRLAPEVREELADLLIVALERRAAAAACDLIQFRVPRSDRPLVRALHKRDYLARPFEALQWVTVELAGLLEALLHHRRPRFPADWSPSFLLRLEPGEYHFSPQRRLGIEISPRPKVEADPASPNYSVTIATDYSTLTELIFKRITFHEAVADRRLEVEPEERSGDAATLVELISLRSPWYTPLADVR